MTFSSQRYKNFIKHLKLKRDLHLHENDNASFKEE